jgi:hypothetical protein
LIETTEADGRASEHRPMDKMAFVEMEANK